jgi:hypothetical protein
MKRKVTVDVERIVGGSEAVFRVWLIHDNGNRELAMANTVMANDLADLAFNGVLPQAKAFGIGTGPVALKRITIDLDYNDAF